MAADASALSKLVPGFDFLESLVKNAGSAIPGMGQWIAPTIDPAELDKRIQELRTVQYWLEQNARMLGATIQALEVQRMTVSTLQNMNVQMSDLRDALLVPAQPAATSAEAPAPKAPRPRAQPASAQAPAAKAPPAVDPMQWWGALTRQFADLAGAALKNGDGSAAVPTAMPPAARPAPAAKRPAAAPRTKKTSAPTGARGRGQG